MAQTETERLNPSLPPILPSEQGPPIGYETLGTGPSLTLVVHDWSSDRTEWETVLPYLSLDKFTYAFIDLRGYGLSRDVSGSYTLEEAVQDVLAVADHLGWDRFNLVVHSMSTPVGLTVANQAARRVGRLVLITPVPTTGLQLDNATTEFMKATAQADNATMFENLRVIWGDRLSDAWFQYKVAQWREAASPDAAATYVDMWGRTDITDEVDGLEIPILVIAGGQDLPVLQPAALQEAFLPLFPNAEVVTLSDVSHYPMQEAPPLLATHVERFLAASAE